ncbi:hypothetical protein [Dactylosporangium sp. NPDC005555]|uniref:hypothetical protein n=1 Tax=Dactylosporangium sp. NPDC005555 TaxID=3154889 RepID=UPI0033BB437E
MTVCRDCCCGSPRKHPDVDHAGQVARLRAALGQAEVRVSGCLDACERSNIVVVHPTPAAGRAGARPVWLGYLLDDAVIGDLTAWVEAGTTLTRSPAPPTSRPSTTGVSAARCRLGAARRLCRRGVRRPAVR